MAVALSGSIVLEGSITGSLLGTSSYSSNAGLLNGLDSSVFALTSSVSAFSSSLNGFTSSINTYTASNNDSIADIRVATASLYAATASLYTATSSIYLATASLYAATASLNQYTASLNLNSSSFATTGSNVLVGNQYITATSNPNSFTATASLYTDGGLRVVKDLYVSGTSYFNNVTVFGTQSINYITSSQLNIASNLITVNTATPSVRFGGLAVYDSGSLGTGLTGSILWDSEANHWVYSNPSGSSYSGGMFISGPRSSALGSEQGTTNNALMKGQGGDHITSSAVFEVSGSVGIGTSTPSYKLEVLGGTANNQIARFIAADYPAHSIGLGIEAIGSNWGASIFQDDVRRFTVEENGGILVGSSYQSSNAPTNGAIIQGNVGIGTTNPATNLDVRGGAQVSGSGAYLDIKSTTTTGTVNVYGVDTSTNFLGYLVSSDNNSRWRFGMIDGRKFEIKPADGDGNFTPTAAITILSGSANVGIGTTSPIEKLDVRGWIYNYGAQNASGFKHENSGGGHVVILNANDSYAQLYTTGVTPLMLGTNNNSRVYIESGGNIGIGTTSPTRDMVLYRSSGEVHLKLANGTTGQTTTDGFDMAIDSNGGAYLINRENQPMHFFTNGSERMRITNNGNVGIGTTSPVTYGSKNLDVNAGSSGSAYIVARANSNAGTAELAFDTDAGYLSTKSNHSLIFRTNDIERMRITSGSFVGIGTSNPQRGLHINGTDANAEFELTNTAMASGARNFNIWGYPTDGTWNIRTLTDNSGAQSVNFISFLASNGNVGIGSSIPGAKLDVNGTSIFRNELKIEYTNAITTLQGGSGHSLIRAYGNTSGVEIQMDAHSSNSGAGTIGNYSNSDLYFKTNNTNKMVIKAGGNVGIGTTSPSNLLSVRGNADFGTTGYSYAGPAQYGALTFSRGQILWSNTNTQNQLYLASNAYNNASGVFAYRNSSQRAVALGMDDGSFSFLTAGTGTADATISWTNAMTIANGGNVGIGSASPGYKLDVNGGAADTSLVVQNTGQNAVRLRLINEEREFILTNNPGDDLLSLYYAGLNRLQFNTTNQWFPNGNVGIGTTSPGCSLDMGSRTDALRLPNGTTAQRPSSATAGMGRFNTDTTRTEFYNGTVWVSVGGSGDGSTSSSPATSAKAIKQVVGNPTSGVYWLQVPNVNSGNPFQCYCDFTMDGGVGYAIIFNQYFTGAETGPSTTSFGSSTVSTAGFETEYQINPTAMISNYGITKLAVFARIGGTAGGGITGSSYYNWVAFTGPTTTQYNNIFTNTYNSNQFTGTFNSSDGNTGTAYFPNSHGATGGVMQISTNGGTVNNYILYEYNPNGGSDPNHFWMVANGRDGDTYWVVNNRYGSSSGNVLYNRWGGVAIY